MTEGTKTLGSSVQITVQNYGYVTISLQTKFTYKELAH